MTHTIQFALCTGTRRFEIIHQRAVSDTRTFWHVNQRHGRRFFLRSISFIIFFRVYAFHRCCSQLIANFDMRNEMFVGVVYRCFCVNDDSIGMHYKQRYIDKYSLKSRKSKLSWGFIPRASTMLVPIEVISKILLYCEGMLRQIELDLMRRGGTTLNCK